MADVLLGLGSQDPKATEETGLILFYVPVKGQDTPNFQTIQRDAQYTWTSADRLSRDPAMQFTGPGEDNVVIEGCMYPYFFRGLTTLERMRLAGRAGKPMSLVRFYNLVNPNGYGAEVIGNYVIRRVRSVESKISIDGIARKIDFSLELQRYGDDLDAVSNVLDDNIRQNEQTGT